MIALAAWVDRLQQLAKSSGASWILCFSMIRFDLWAKGLIARDKRRSVPPNLVLVRGLLSQETPLSHGPDNKAGIGPRR